MPEFVPFKIEIQVSNKRALRALRVVAEVLSDVADDFPYRNDVQRAVRAAKYAAKHLTFAETPEKP